MTDFYEDTDNRMDYQKTTVDFGERTREYLAWCIFESREKLPFFDAKMINTYFSPIVKQPKRTDYLLYEDQSESKASV